MELPLTLAPQEQREKLHVVLTTQHGCTCTTYQDVRGGNEAHARLQASAVKQPATRRAGFAQRSSVPHGVLRVVWLPPAGHR